MKLCTCFSALVSSNFLATTATTRAVQPAPYERQEWGGGRRTESASTEVELVNLWFLDRELVQMIEGSKDKYEDDRRRSEWERGED